jgi:hypothetical protein
VTARPGLVLAAVFLGLYGALAITVDLPKATYGFKSDEATYYMMGLSLAHDGDLAYERKDLVRVWREFPSGPQGVFLKRGKTLQGAPDPDPSRYYFGKSFIYPLFAAPLIVGFGSNGFLLLNAICLALVLLCAYLFLHARSGPWTSALLAAAFVMMSVVPVYAVQMMPEVFNFSLVCLAYFCWRYKEVAAPERSPRGTRWLFTWRSDVATAVLLGLATFSKVTNALLFAAPFVWWGYRMFRLKPETTGNATGDVRLKPETTGNATGDVRLKPETTGNATGDFRLKPETTGNATGDSVASGFSRRLLLPALVFLLVGGGLFGINMLISGEWNYQGGGDRKSYYHQFPFQNQAQPPSSTPVAPDELERQLGVPKSRDTAMTDVIFNPRTFGSNLRHNLAYFFAGRFAGLAGYFFPGLFAMLALLAAPRKRPGWQWLVLAAALAQGLIFIVATPYTWSGGGVGNRYFLSGYGVMVFLLPPIESLALAFVPWIGGALFVAPMVVSPFTASFRSDENARSGPLRMFPVELTLLNDLPIFTPERGRIWFGGQGPTTPGFLVTFLDDNAYGREEDASFWTRGDSRAELVFKANTAMRRAIFDVAAGPVATSLTIEIAGRRQRLDLTAGQTERVTIALKGGLPYEKEVENVQLWPLTLVTRGGFTPIFFDPNTTDARYLGIRVKPMLEVRPQ